MSNAPIPVAALSLALALSLTQVSTGASAQATPPDLVRTRDGALYRGVIVENVPNDHILLLMPNGETRRIAASEISSTEVAPPSPAVTATTPAPSATTSTASTPREADVVVGRGRLRFTVVSDSPGLTLHGAAFRNPLQRICFERCELRIDPGHYQFAVEDTRARVRPMPRALLLDRDGELRISMHSRTKARVILGVLGLALSLGSIGIWTAEGRFENPDWGGGTVKPTYIIGGSMMLGLGFVFLGGAIGMRDRGQVEFAPY